MASSIKTKKLINTTGKAYVATVKNGVVTSENPVTIKMGTVVEQVGATTKVMDVVYFYDSTGKLYNMQDFAIVTPKEEKSTDNTIYWLGGGLLLFWILSGNKTKK